MTDTEGHAEEAAALAKSLRDVLAGVEPHLIGAALGEMCAMLIAGHHPEMRDVVRQQLFKLIDDLVPLTVEEIIADGRAPETWRNKPPQEKKQ